MKPNKKFSLTIEDLRILKLIKEKGKLGTIKLAKKVGLAPKNLINRLKKYEKLNLISKNTTPTKPKGRKRNWYMDIDVIKIIEDYEAILEELRLLSERKSPIIEKLKKMELSEKAKKFLKENEQM